MADRKKASISISNGSVLKTQNQQALQQYLIVEHDDGDNSSDMNGGAYDGEEYEDYSGTDEGQYYDNGDGTYDGSDSGAYGQGEDDDDDYPDMLQFCEAQFDEDDALQDDEEARGLPPVTQGYYDNNDDVAPQGNSRTRITTNESGIRIVESSTILESEDDEQSNSYAYQEYEPTPPPPPKKIRMNRPRKFRPEQAAAEALLRQLQAGYFDYDPKPNILARKLMGAPSQSVQPKPPPLIQKPSQKNLQNRAPTTISPTISLESILRQQPSVSRTPCPPKLQPKSASSLLSGQNLKIKSSHGIPSQKIPNSTSVYLQQKVQRLGQNQNLPNKSMLKHNSSSAYLPRKLQSNSPYNIPQKLRVNNTVVRKVQNGSGVPSSAPPSVIFNSNRISIASIQQQVQAQQTAMQLQQQKPQKNVPRCQICKRTFATNQVLQRHMALHNREVTTVTEADVGEYKCGECGENFDNPLALAQHLQSHSQGDSESTVSSGGVHRCRVCYRTFTCAESLKAHSMMHDGEFKCRACRRGFTDWNALEEHEATHKRYNCQWCEKYFMNSGNLKAHERIHTGERPYKCADCPKAFKQLGGLQYHLKTNPTHKPQKYHKHDLEAGDDAEDSANGGFQYASFESEDLTIRHQQMPLSLSLSDIAASCGL